MALRGGFDAVRNISLPAEPLLFKDQFQKTEETRFSESAVQLNLENRQRQPPFVKTGRCRLVSRVFL